MFKISLKTYDIETDVYLKVFSRAIRLVKERLSSENSPLSQKLFAMVINAALYHYVAHLNVLNIVKLTRMHSNVIDLDANICTISINWLFQLTKSHTKDKITRLGWQIDISKAPKLRLELRKVNQIMSALEGLKFVYGSAQLFNQKS